MSVQSKIKFLNLIDKYTERMFKINPSLIKMYGDDKENLIGR